MWRTVSLVMANNGSHLCSYVEVGPLFSFVADLFKAVVKKSMYTISSSGKYRLADKSDMDKFLIVLKQLIGDALEDVLFEERRAASLKRGE